MKEKLKKIAIPALAILVILLLGIIVFLATRKTPQPQQEPPSISTSLQTEVSTPTIVESLPATSSEVATENVQDESIIEVADSFLQAQYTFDSDDKITSEEYLKSFDGLITQNGQENMKSFLQRVSDVQEGVQIIQQLTASNTYMGEVRGNNVTTLSTIYVRTVTLIENEDPKIFSYPLLIRMELIKEQDGVFRVNSISSIVSLSNVNIDINELMG